MRTKRTALIALLFGAALVPATTTQASAGPYETPDDAWVVYTADLGSDRGLCMVRAGGPGVGVTLIDSSAHEYEPAWAPDGRRLAYVSGDDAGPTIEILDLVAGTSHSIGSGSYPSWSPDGERIAFRHQGFIWTATADDGSERTQIVGGYHPAWSPDGNEIAFADDQRDGVYDDGGIWLMDTDGDNQRRLSNGEYPEWSPDGDELVANFGFFANGLYIIDSDSGETRTLIQADHPGEGPFFTDPMWSPQDERIAFTRIVQGFGSGVWTIASDGSDARLLVDQAWSEFDPTWQPLVEGAFEDPGDREACSHHPHPMSIELRLRGHLRATGVVDSPAGPNCTRGAPVVIERRKTRAQPWRNALSVNADDFGTFETKLQDRPGRYRAVIRWEGSAGPCAGARSGVMRHRHRR